MTSLTDEILNESNGDFKLMVELCRRFELTILRLEDDNCRLNGCIDALNDDITRLNDEIADKNAEIARL